jgi:hypothetical protein
LHQFQADVQCLVLPSIAVLAFWSQTQQNNLVLVMVFPLLVLSGVAVGRSPLRDFVQSSGKLEDLFGTVCFGIGSGQLFWPLGLDDLFGYCGAVVAPILCRCAMLERNYMVQSSPKH